LASEQEAHDHRRRQLAGWIAREIMPSEGIVRSWLRPRVRAAEDVDDIIQEAYARMADITAFDQIDRPSAFFMQTVRNLLIDLIRRDKIVPIIAVGGTDELPMWRDDMDPERIAAARRELMQVMTLVDMLPERCRTIFRMRKIDGLSQKEIAMRLGVSISIVENDAVKGLVQIMKALRSPRSGLTSKKRT
jgi:RNA polymerase sigma-70 factor (ECF subfamily)